MIRICGGWARVRRFRGHEHGRAGLLSLGERFERRAADLYGTPVLIDRTPGCHEAETSMKAGTAAARKTDYERKTVAGRVPYLQIHETNDAAELHVHPT